MKKYFESFKKWSNGLRIPSWVTLLGVVSFMFLNTILMGALAHRFAPECFAAITGINALAAVVQKITVPLAILYLVIVAKRQGVEGLKGFKTVENPIFRLIFWINRIASCTPAVYGLVIGIGKFPWIVIVYIAVDLGAAIIVALAADKGIAKVAEEAEKITPILQERMEKLKARYGK